MSVGAIAIVLVALHLAKPELLGHTAPGPQLRAARLGDERPCPDLHDKATLVLVALGQSNAGNHGGAPSASDHGVQLVAGRCYRIADPLADATGAGGSIWSRLASALGHRGTERPLVLVLLAVESTRAAEWTARTKIAARLDDLLHDLASRGVAVSAILWQQGEADARAGTSRGAYVADLEAVIRRIRGAGIDAPVLLAHSTRCGPAVTTPIREARIEVASAMSNVRIGPDTDRLDDSYRVDGCHFTAQGLDAAARDWHQALVDARIIAR
jgi:hypothetical protein